MPSSKGFKSTSHVPGHFKSTSKVINTLYLCSLLATFLFLASHLNFLIEILLQWVLTTYYNNQMVNEGNGLEWETFDEGEEWDILADAIPISIVMSAVSISNLHRIRSWRPQGVIKTGGGRWEG